MLFSSFAFLLVFLPIVIGVYYVSPRKIRNAVLCIFSIFFYAYGEPKYVVLLLISSLVDYTVGRMLEHTESFIKRRICLMVSIICNIGLLAVFKYSGLFPLPIGISFYTFQTLSYTIDVYRKKVDAQHNFITFCAYVSFFPQLIAGPIVQYKTVEKELSGRRENWTDFSEGAFRFCVGLAKKVVIANSIGELFKEISMYQADRMFTSVAWLSVIAFALQIYFDFSGYSDMAIGLGRIFGFHFLENFDHPYESKSITEFWRRWHISLGTWFREYVYIPLGGNKKGLLRQCINILIVWLLTGAWHGAHWCFVLWGLFYAFWLMLEKLFLLKLLEKLPKLVGRIYTLTLVVIAWSLFCYPDVVSGNAYMDALLFQGAGVSGSEFHYLLSTYGSWLVIAAFGATSIPKRIGLFICEKTNSSFVKTVFMMICFTTSLIFLISGTYNPFLYFRF